MRASVLGPAHLDHAWAIALCGPICHGTGDASPGRPPLSAAIPTAAIGFQRVTLSYTSWSLSDERWAVYRDWLAGPGISVSWVLALDLADGLVAKAPWEWFAQQRKQHDLWVGVVQEGSDAVPKQVGEMGVLWMPDDRARRSRVFLCPRTWTGKRRGAPWGAAVSDVARSRMTGTECAPDAWRHVAPGERRGIAPSYRALQECYESGEGPPRTDGMRVDGGAVAGTKVQSWCRGSATAPTSL